MTPNIQTVSLRKINVLHVCLEYGEASYGGLGSMVTQLSQGQNEFMGGQYFESTVITPFYHALYPYREDQLQFMQTLTFNFEDNLSEVNLWFHVSTYSRHYLLEPIQQKNYYQLASCQDIYSNNPVRFFSKMLYFNAAAAVAINFLTPKLDIIQLHDWHTALVSKLLLDRYQLHLPMVFTVHTHCADNGHGLVSRFTDLDLHFSDSKVNLKVLGLQNATKIVAVSRTFLRECESLMDLNNVSAPTLATTYAFLSAKFQRRSCSIPNGICLKQYLSIQTFNALSNFNKAHFRQVLNKIMKYKFAIDFNIDWPLVVFIGRFAIEKGLEQLGQLLELLGRQPRLPFNFIAMGRGDLSSMQPYLIKTRHLPGVLVSNQEQFQIEYGSLIRSAADFSLVPSWHESFGLVAIEGLANGAACIAANVGGLRDSIKPFNEDFSMGTGYLFDSRNLISYEQTIGKAIRDWQKLDDKKKTNLQIRLINEAAQYNWQNPKGSLLSYYQLYQTIPKPTCENLHKSNTLALRNTS